MQVYLHVSQELDFAPCSPASFVIPPHQTSLWLLGRSKLDILTYESVSEELE